MLLRFLIILFALNIFYVSITNAKDTIITHDTLFLSKLNSTKKTEKRIDMIILFASNKTEKVRVTLETIAVNTKQNDRVRMQAICSLEKTATHKSVPILLDILETDLIQRRGFWACAIPILGNLQDRRAIPLLLHIANLNENHLSGIDHKAINALALLGDEREVPFLISKAYILPVRLSVIKGLARIASVESINTLIEALQGAEEPEVVNAAENGLLKIGKTAIQKLNKALIDNRDKESRSRIQTLIQKIRNMKTL